MDIAESIVGGEKGSGGTTGQLEEVEKLGDIAVAIGMAPNGGIIEMAFTESTLVRFAGRWAYRGRTNDGRMNLRFVDTAMGHAETSPVGIYKNLPRQ